MSDLITQPAGVQQAPRSKRIEWVDFAKGVAIALVVYGHVFQGVACAGNIDDRTHRFFLFSDALVYSFHMPAFFFLSGLFLQRALKNSPGGFLRDRLKSIFWPYLLWQFVKTCSEAAFKNFYNHPEQHPFQQLLTLLWNPHGFWFLYTLFWGHVICFALRKAPPAAVLLGACGAYLSGFRTGIDPVDSVITYLPFLSAGICAGPFLGSFAAKSRLAAVVGALVLGLLQVIFIRFDFENILVFRLLLGFTGTAALVCVSWSLGPNWLYRWGCRVGEASLAVFLLHPFLQGFTRAVTAKALHLGSPALQVVCQTAVAVAGSTLVWQWSKRWNFWCLFTLKRPKELVRPSGY